MSPRWQRVALTLRRRSTGRASSRIRSLPRTWRLSLSSVPVFPICSYRADDFVGVDRLGVRIPPEPVHLGRSLESTSPASPLAQRLIDHTTALVCRELLQESPDVIVNDYVDVMRHGSRVPSVWPDTQCSTMQQNAGTPAPRTACARCAARRPWRPQGLRSPA